MRVAEGVDELAGLQPRHLRHHHGQQRVGGDVERHAEEDVGGALIELAGQPAPGDIELEQAMARRQRHLVDVGRIPGGDDQAARIRIAPDHVHHVGDLVDGAAVLRRPGAPLLAVDRAEIAVLVGPFVPDPHAVVVEIFDVGVAGQEPEQLVDDRLEVQLLGGDQREAVARDRSASDGRTPTACRCRCGRASPRRPRSTCSISSRYCRIDRVSVCANSSRDSDKRSLAPAVRRGEAGRSSASI